MNTLPPTHSYTEKSPSSLFERLYQKAKYVTSWVRKQLELTESYSLKAEEDQCKPYVCMGEIYYAHMGSNIGSEIDKERPVLIFQNNDRFVRQSNMVIVIPISSNVTAKPYRIPIYATDIIDNQGINNSSIIVHPS